jgi:hypothetical protein
MLKEMLWLLSDVWSQAAMMGYKLWLAVWWCGIAELGEIWSFLG